MKTIASKGFNKYYIRLVTNGDKKDNGIYLITDIDGNEHEAGIWERMQDYDLKNDRFKKTYIYCGKSFNQLKKEKRRKKYYTLCDMMYNQLCRFIKENEEL